MTTRFKVSIALAALLGAASVPVAAQTTTTATTSVTDQWHMPYQQDFWNYIGATVGSSDYDVDCVAGFSCDRRDVGFKVFAGGKLYNVLGLELGYVHLGSGDIAGGHTTAHGANLSLVLGIPFYDRFGVNAKVGTTYGWTRTNVAVDCASFGGCGYERRNESGWGLSYGLGATYAFTRNTELRIDWDRYRFDFAGSGGSDVDLVSAGLNFRF